jgi:hypothetical protein
VELNVTEKEVRVASVFVEEGSVEDEEEVREEEVEENRDDDGDDSELLDDDEDTDVEGSGVGFEVRPDVDDALEDVMETPLDDELLLSDKDSDESLLFDDDDAEADGVGVKVGVMKSESVGL